MFLSLSKPHQLLLGFNEEVVKGTVIYPWTVLIIIDTHGCLVTGSFLLLIAKR